MLISILVFSKSRSVINVKNITNSEFFFLLKMYNQLDNLLLYSFLKGT